MDIDAAEARRGKDRLRQDQAIGRDHRDIGIERGKGGLLGGVAQGRGVAHHDAQRLGPVMDRSPPLALAATRCSGGLGVGAHQLVPRRDEGVEGRQREVGGTHEDDPHGRRLCRPLPASPSALCR